MAEPDAAPALEAKSAFEFLVRKAGKVNLAVISGLMLVASLSEGIGLLLLVPITHLVASSDDSAAIPQWLNEFADWPLGALLSGMVLLVSVRALIVYLVNERRRLLGLTLARELRQNLHRALRRADWRWLARQSSADHAAHLTGEVERAATLANQMIAIASASITIGLLVVSAAFLSWHLTLLVLAAGFAAGALMALFRTRDGQAGERYAAAYTALQDGVSRGMRHLRAARIAGAELQVGQQFEQTALQLAELETRYFRSSHRSLLLMQTAAAAILAGLVYYALAIEGMAPALVVPVLVIFARIAPLVGTLHQGFRSWHYNAPALQRLRRTLSEAESHLEAALPAATVPPFSDNIELRGVRVDYDGRDAPALGETDLLIPFGAIVGVAGKSGSGKSSLADVLCGLIEPDAGTLFVDGTKISGAGRIAWRTQVAYLEQSPLLFNGTIAENLAWACTDAREEAMWEALEAAAADFVRGLPDGLHTVMGDEGHSFSGGEQRRIALARVLLAKPRLLVLDEATAGLDPDAGNAIMATVEHLRERMAVVVMSHDPRVLNRADWVVTLGENNSASVADAHRLRVV